MNYFFYAVLATCFFISCSENVSPTDGNNPPIANLIISPTSGHIFTSFIFDASASADPDESSYNLLVRWDWENDGTWDTGYAIAKMVTHKFASEGTKTVKIEVMDSEGLTDSTITQISVIPPIYETGTVTDVDGNIYKTIKIGNQWWMAENLKVSHYQNGDCIPFIVNSYDWEVLKTDGYSVWENDVAFADTFGYLYNWFAVSDSRKIAPIGWHVSTDEEWKELENYLGMSQLEADKTDWRGVGTGVGGKLKETGTTHWNSPNTGATNESGFSALPGGYRNYYMARYEHLGDFAIYITSTEIDDKNIWLRSLFKYNSWVRRDTFYRSKYSGFSVRCVKD